MGRGWARSGWSAQAENDWGWRGNMGQGGAGRDDLQQKYRVLSKTTDDREESNCGNHIGEGVGWERQARAAWAWLGMSGTQRDADELKGKREREAVAGDTTGASALGSSNCWIVVKTRAIPPNVFSA